MSGLPLHDFALTRCQDTLGQLAYMLEDVRSGASSGMPRDELCRYVDGVIPRVKNLITAAEGTIIHLRNLRNGHIHRLPPELLSLVFGYLVSSGRPGVDLVRATHVCRSWRAIALDNALLWTHLVGFDDVQKTWVFIERSKQLLLHIHIKPGLSMGMLTQFCKIFRDMPERLESLVIEADDLEKLRYFMHYGMAVASYAAPHLQTLHLSIDPRHVVRSEDIGEERGVDIFRPDDITHHQPLSLRSLRLQEIGIPWDSPFYANLYVLDLNTPDMYPPSQRRLLEVLKQCPSLMDLRLCIRDPRAPYVPNDDPAWIVSLPLLSGIALENMSPVAIQSILTHLSLPSTTRHDYQILEGGDARYAILPADRSRLPGLLEYDRVEYHPTMTFHSLEQEWVLIEFYHQFIGGIGDPILSLLVAATRRSLTNLVASFDITSTKTFVVSGPHGDVGATREWRALFASLDSMRTLRLVSPMEVGSCVNALKVLAGQDDSLSTAVGEEQPCPQLREIELIGVQCSELLLEALLRVCSRRQEMGLPLSRLELLEVNPVPPEVVRRLQALVPEVSVNEC